MKRCFRSLGAIFLAAILSLALVMPVQVQAAQHDFDITTADANTGVTMRAAINAALQALASTNSGAIEPATPYAYQLWADTTADLLKIRNAANTGWITICKLSTGSPGSKLGTFTKSTADVSATQAYTGVGFKPSTLIVLACVDDVAAGVSIGFSNGSLNYSVSNAHRLVANTWKATANVVGIWQAAGYAATYTGDCSSLDADGFTIAWSKGGTVTETITVYYLAIR